MVGGGGGVRLEWRGLLWGHRGAIVKCGGGCQDGGQRGGDPHCPAKGGWRTQRLLPAVRLGRENGTP